MTLFDSLVRLVAPPAEAVDAHGDWDAAETVVGVRLPGDYRRLVETYGWGEFCDFLYFRTPFGTSRYNGLHWQTGRLTGSPERDAERHPYPLHPSAGGLLIWGTTMDADRLCWLTVGAPEDWPVVVWSSEGWYETFAMGATEFVEGWAAGRVSSRLLGDMEPDLTPWFNAFRPRIHRCLRLSEGPLPYPERLRILRDALAPTADRGGWKSETDGARQDHFATMETDWNFTYETPHPHQIRAAVPLRDMDQARQRLFDTVRLMGCRVLQITTAGGTILPGWDAMADEDPAEN